MQTQENSRHYEIVTWRDVAKQIRAINSELADAIDEIDPPASWKIVKVRYAFGDELLQKGELFVPHKGGKLLGINDPDFNPELCSLLNYQSMPVGLTLQATMELFISHSDKIYPYNITYPGRVFALWGGLDTDISAFHGKIWNMTAGCRSLFFLPKITDKIALKRISREFGVDFKIPRSLWEQYYLLKKISAFQDDPWYLETIFFDKNWIRIEGKKQQKLRYFLLNSGWKSTSILRDNVIFDFVYSSAQMEKNIRIDPYLADTIKHLYALGRGAYPGFVFSDSDLCAPISFFQQVFNEIYDLEYSPTLMNLGYLYPGISTSLFYSLQLPTLLQFSPKSRENSTNIDALYYIQSSMKRLENYILNEGLQLKGQEIYKWAKHIKYSYFHPHSSNDHAIQSITALMKQEPILQTDELKYKKQFCETNIFMRGLIKC